MCRRELITCGLDPWGDYGSLVGVQVVGNIILVACVAFCLGCVSSGAQEALGKKICAPVIHALHAYKLKHDRFPDSVEQLTPDFIPKIPLGPDETPLYYQREETEFLLSFNYDAGWYSLGISACVYMPRHLWSCGAYL